MKNNKKNLLSLAVLAAGMFGASVSMAAADTFKVGMEITYPPFESYDKDKNVVGSDPELATSLAKHMNAKVEFVDTK
ncbi:MAG: transporter substrate-binding domain-containing protein, partial [Pseudomonas sp.]